MLGLLILILTAAISFGAGYVTRAAVSRKRRAEYLKWEPYLPPSSRPSRPPAFLRKQGPQINAIDVPGPVSATQAPTGADRRRVHVVSGSARDAGRAIRQ
jgi:hypothetical protein